MTKERKHLFMNDAEGIYMLKVVNTLYEKYMTSVTRRMPNANPPPERAGAHRQNFGRSRWPRWWSSWTAFDGRPGPWGECQRWGLAKALTKYVHGPKDIPFGSSAVIAIKAAQYYLLPSVLVLVLVLALALVLVRGRESASEHFLFLHSFPDPCGLYRGGSPCQSQWARAVIV